MKITPRQKLASKIIAKDLLQTRFAKRYLSDKTVKERLDILNALPSDEWLDAIKADDKDYKLSKKDIIAKIAGSDCFIPSFLLKGSK